MQQNIHDNIGTQSVSQGSALRRTKALVLLQELQQAEEQRLAEFHTDYEPVPHLTRFEIMDNNQDNDHTRNCRLYGGEFQDNMLSPELEAPMMAGKNQKNPHRSYSLKNVDPSCRHLAVDKPHHRRVLSESAAELDTAILEKPMPELPGPEIEASRSFTTAGQSSIGYGDKRYQTLPGEAIPLSKSSVSLVR